MGRFKLWVKILSICVLLVLIFSGNNHHTRIYSSENKNKYITPDSIFYLPKRLVEKIQKYLVIGSKNHDDFEYYLLDKRLIELKILVSENKINDIITATQRYSAQLANVTTDKKHIKKHLDLLTSLQTKFVYDSAYWLSIQHAINTIEIIHGKI